MAPENRHCDGTRSRLAFVRSGMTALGGLGLADLLKLEGEARATGISSNGKSMIVLWLWGGPSHMETFDMKPEAPVEYRGDFRPIRTNVPGIEISEHLPKLARLADKFAILRSCHHDSPGHVNSTHTMLTGYPGELVEQPPFQPKYPDFWSIAQKELGPKNVGLPAHVVMPYLRYHGAAYLGGGLDPFVLAADPNGAKYKVPELSLATTQRIRFQERLGLLDRFDGVRRSIDAENSMQSMDEFSKKALSILTSDAAQKAMDIRREHPRARDLYGRHAVGQRCLLARRLVEAGARIVTVDFPCVPGQKAFSWDDHASVWNIFDQMKIRLPILDQIVSALISDLHERGLSKDVLLVVMGEMSHTPRINYFNGNPGREHWSRSMSILMAGGGLRMGQAVGSTNHKGEEPRDRPVSPADVLATWYKCLGVPLDRHYADHFGRPVPILPGGHPIDELI